MENLIRKHYNSADIKQITEGTTWYERAHNECVLLSSVFGIPLPKVIGVVSALSPSNKWKRNLQDAWKFLDKPHMNTKVCTFKNQRRKALNILKGTGREAEILSELNGTKTQHFFTNILYYKDSQTVTVDMWAYRSVNVESKQKYYKQVQTAYQNVARELDLLPHQLQAVVWGVVRGSTV